MVVAAYKTKNKGRYVEGLLCSPVVKTSASKAGSVGWISDQGIKIPHASRPKKKKHQIEAML